MERRFSNHLEQLMADATVKPGVLRDLLPRLERFIEPFADLMATPQQRRHLHEYAAGLISNEEHKTAEAIAYLVSPASGMVSGAVITFPAK